tara:strand:- start:8083 stop:8232 length:150 start_codon:yes stop_codon:yes gene_type:complete
MNTISELYVLIDWTCHFSDLENKLTDSLKIIEKIKMEKLKEKKNYFKIL